MGLFAGQNAWAQAQPIFTQLVEDLKAHAGDALPIVQQAIAQLTQVVASSGKRSTREGILDFVLNAFDLSSVWGTITQLGGSVVAQFTGLAEQLLFAGQNAWAQAQPIFSQLVEDLKAHAGGALPIVQQAIAQLTQVLVSSG